MRKVNVRRLVDSPSASMVVVGVVILTLWRCLPKIFVAIVVGSSSTYSSSSAWRLKILWIFGAMILVLSCLSLFWFNFLSFFLLLFLLLSVLSCTLSTCEKTWNDETSLRISGQHNFVVEIAHNFHRSQWECNDTRTSCEIIIHWQGERERDFVCGNFYFFSFFFLFFTLLIDNFFFFHSWKSLVPFQRREKVWAFLSIFFPFWDCSRKISFSLLHNFHFAHLFFFYNLFTALNFQHTQEMRENSGIFPLLLWTFQCEWERAGDMEE